MSKSTCRLSSSACRPVLGCCKSDDFLHACRKKLNKFSCGEMLNVCIVAVLYTSVWTNSAYKSNVHDQFKALIFLRVPDIGDMSTVALDKSTKSRSTCSRHFLVYISPKPRLHVKSTCNQCVRCIVLPLRHAWKRILQTAAKIICCPAAREQTIDRNHLSSLDVYELMKTQLTIRTSS
jgi:hypothetical protein